MGKLASVLGLRSGMTCWRRLRDWNANGVWQRLYQVMLVRLREHDQIDWSRASIDGSSVPSPGGPGDEPQSSRQRQARLQTTYRRRCQRHPTGDPRQRCQQARLHAVREVHGCDSSRCRRARAGTQVAGEAACGQRLRLQALRCLSEATRHRQSDCQARYRKQRKIGQASLGRGENTRMVAGFGKLRIRFERRLDIHDALLKLAAAIICEPFVDRWC